MQRFCTKRILSPFISRVNCPKNQSRKNSWNCNGSVLKECFRLFISREKFSVEKNCEMTTVTYLMNALNFQFHGKMSKNENSKIKKGISQPAGFEPARGNPIGFQVQRLNHSATTALLWNGDEIAILIRRETVPVLILPKWF